RPKILEDFVVFGDQQLGISQGQGRHLVISCMKSEELDEHQHIMASMAQEVSDHLRRMDRRYLNWSTTEAHWVLPGHFKEHCTFYFDLESGDDGIIKYWDFVEEADMMESRSLINSNCFKAVHQNYMGSSSVIDAMRARRWESIYCDKNE
ncbi:unnamed protein product, partial [Prorocentrum cordatum]